MRIIHWFRNDLRLTDNTALAAAAAQATELLPVYIVDPALSNRHRSTNRRAYLARCIASLSRDLEAAGCPLLVLEGSPSAILSRLAGQTKADRLTFNRDYTPYSKRRDAEAEHEVTKSGATVATFKDRAIFESGEVLTQSGTPFKVFTPYRNAWAKLWKGAPQAPAPAPRLPKRLPTPDEGSADDKVAAWDVEDLEAPAGEGGAADRLAAFLDGPVEHYADHRDLPALDGTSRLSPALRFGTISIRTCVAEALARRRENKRFTDGAVKWIDELIWRDFYMALLDVHPQVLGTAFRSEYRDVEWNDDPDGFEAWCRGETGFPIVDAAMRQLVQTGWMHNRARMIVASFLVKDLLVDWRKGERFFMKHLLDGDPASNNGGWQWAASTGTDAQPYFRIFNPTSQGKRYDPDGAYVRRFVAELEPLSKRHIHEPWKSPNPPAGYPAPIVDHAERRVTAIARFEAAKENRGGTLTT